MERCGRRNEPKVQPILARVLRECVAIIGCGSQRSPRVLAGKGLAAVALRAWRAPWRTLIMGILCHAISQRALPYVSVFGRLSGRRARRLSRQRLLARRSAGHERSTAAVAAARQRANPMHVGLPDGTGRGQLRGCHDVDQGERTDRRGSSAGARYHVIAGRVKHGNESEAETCYECGRSRDYHTDQVKVR